MALCYYNAALAESAEPSNPPWEKNIIAEITNTPLQISKLWAVVVRWSGGDGIEIRGAEIAERSASERWLIGFGGLKSLRINEQVLHLAIQCIIIESLLSKTFESAKDRVKSIFAPAQSAEVAHIASSHPKAYSR